MYVVGNNKMYLYKLYKQDKKRGSLSTLMFKVQKRFIFPTVYIFCFILKLNISEIDETVIKVRGLAL